MLPARARWFLGLALILLGGIAVWLGLKGGSPRHQVIVWFAEPGPWGGMTADERLGAITLLLDHLEIQARGPLMERGGSQNVPAGAKEIRVAGSREGMNLLLQGSTRSHGEERAFLLRGLPGEVMAQAAELVGLSRKGTERLMPGTGPGDWSLLEVMGLTSELDLDPKIQRASALVSEFPGCPSAQLALAGLTRLGLNASSISNPETQDRCREYYERTLKLFPYHPRGAHEFSYYLTDTGDQRAALVLLFDALKARPGSARLWGGLAYPARTGGLLAGAQEALRVRDRLQGRSQTELRFADNVHLYAGDLDRFEASLGDGRNQPPNALLDFYRGYSRLLRGDRKGAHARFSAASQNASSSLLFGRIAQIFLLGLEGQSPKARQELDALRDERRRLRVPDGEFTFKLAEAYAFLGDLPEAQVLAERAFDQGFTCADWFQGSPLLAPIRSGPRWQTLLQHVQERQRLLEIRFPADRFKP